MKGVGIISGTFFNAASGNSPSIQATNIVITPGSTTATISWTKGNGTNSLVVIKATTAVDSFPVDSTTYTANAAFGSGSQLGTGNYVVYGGTGNSVNVTALSASTVYHVRVFEFNATSYLTLIGTNNPNSFTTNSTLTADYYVRIGGSDSADGLTVGTAWATMEKAASVVIAGDVVDVGAGTFTINAYLAWPPASITGAGIDQTIFRLHSSKFLNIGGDMFGRILTNGQSMFQMKTTGPRSTTPYTFQNFTIDGQKPAGFSGSTLCMFSAMHLYGRNNFTLNNVKISRTGANALWMVECSNIRITSCEIINCARGRDDLSPSQTIVQWGGGAINHQNTTDVEYDNNSATEDFGGCATKALGGSWSLTAYNAGQLPYATRWKVHDNFCTQNFIGSWTSPSGGYSAAISHEMFDTNSTECEWYNNDFDSNISVVMRRLDGASTDAADPFRNALFSTPRHKFYNNDFFCQRRGGQNQYGIEASTHDIDIFNNYFDCYGQSIVEFGHSGQTPNPGIRRQNINIYRNIFQNNRGYQGGSGIIQEHQGWRNVRIWNNTVLFSGVVTADSTSFFVAATPAADTGLASVGVSENIEMRNNLLIKPASATGPVRYGGKASAHVVNGFVATHNNFFRCNVSTISGTISNNIDQDPLIVGSGSIPGYFDLQSGSPCINTGTTTNLPTYITYVGSNPDMGSREFGSVVTRNIVSLSSVGPVTVDQGTVIGSVPLGTVQATLDDASVVNLNLSYSSGTYNESVPDTYSLTCSPVLTSGITNTSNLTVIKSVIVRSIGSLLDDDFERGTLDGTGNKTYTEIDPDSTLLITLDNNQALGLAASQDSFKHRVYWDAFTHSDHELRVKAVVNFDNLGQTSYGYGIGIQNTVNPNPNRGVIVRVNTLSTGDPQEDAESGKITIYTGNGTTATDSSGYIARITSATKLNLVAGRLYELTLEGVISGSDIVYTAYFQDTISGQQISVQWTETGNPLDTYWSTAFPAIFAFGGYPKTHQFTVDAINVSAPIYGDELQAVIDYANTQGYTLPSTTILDKLDTLISEWISNGTWASKIAIWVMGVDNNAQDFARINYKNPGTFTLQLVGSPTFVNNQGFTLNGTTQYLNTGWDPSNNGGSLWTTNEACLEFYIANNPTAADSKAVLGCGPTGDAGSVYFAKSASNFINHRLNSATVYGYTDSGSMNAYWKMYRTGGTSRKTFKNGSEVFTGSVTHTLALTTFDLYLGAQNNNGTATQFSTHTIGLLMVGAPHTGDETANDTAWDTYLT